MQGKAGNDNPSWQPSEVEPPSSPTGDIEILNTPEVAHRPSKKDHSRSPAATFRSTQISFCGPLPPPGLLAEYERVTPGLADRIVAMAESESTHRRGMEEKIVSGSFSEARLGQVFALVICIVTITVGAYTALNGKEWAGIAIGVSGVSGIVTTFIMGRSAASRNAADPTQQNPKPSSPQKPKPRRKK